jgi:putative DNA primase/helicase
MPSAATNKVNSQNIIDAIQVMFPDPCVVEIRAPKAGKHGTIAGYFELPQHIDKMVAAIEEISGDYNVYWTINSVNPDLLARANNCIKPYTPNGGTTDDKNIVKRNWLAFDCDPVRATGISSSAEEKRAAKLLVSALRKWLTEEMGWPEPVMADSGNGYHALGRIDQHNDDESRDLLEAVLKAAAHKFDNEAVKIDTKLFNASRILKAYGSMAVKGDDMPERPHRMSQMFTPPAAIRVVTKGQLAAVAALAPTPEKKKTKTSGPEQDEGGGWTAEMVEVGLSAAGVGFKPPLSYKGGLKWQHQCFNNADHHCPDAFTMLDKDGWVSEKCSHNSCGDGLNSAEWFAKIEEMAGHEIEKPRRKKFDVRELLASVNAESADSPPPVAASEQHDRETDCPARVFPLNEFGNTERFEWRYGGKFLHTDATGWLVYVNGRWQRDKTSRAEQAVWDTIRLIKLEIQLVDSDKAAEPIIGFAASSECNKMMNAILNLAAGRPTFSRNYADFDQHPELFLCANGTVNLDTGEFCQFDPEHLLTKGSNVKYDPVAACPQWEKFLFEVMDEKAHMVAYLGRAGGYSLSAFTGEQCLFVPYGCGGTGKGTFVNVLQGIMGSYCQIADPEMLMVKKGDSGQPFELAGMEGARGLFASETEKGKTLALSKLKRMTGQDPIRASYKGRDHYTFVPIWKLWLATNDEPSANAEDDAFWERVKVIPFNIKFRNTERQIKDLHIKLLAEESSGILNWFLQGHREWKEGGLQHPEEVNIAVKQWQDTEDYLGRCLKERFAPTTIPGEYISKKDAYEVFGRWSATSKEGDGISTKEFTKQMRAKGFLDKDVRRDGKTVQVWMGLKSVSSYGTTGEPEPDQVW